MSRDEPDRLVGARVGSPLVVGIGIGENFLASDVLALRPVTDRFVFLEEGDLVELTATGAGRLEHHQRKRGALDGACPPR